MTKSDAGENGGWTCDGRNCLSGGCLGEINGSG